VRSATKHGRPVHLTPPSMAPYFRLPPHQPRRSPRSRPGSCWTMIRTRMDLALRQDQPNQTVRRHWEQATKVNIKGERVTLEPGRPSRPGPNGRKPGMAWPPRPCSNGYLRTADPEELPARQTACLTWPGLPVRPGVPTRTGANSVTARSPSSRSPPARARTAFAEMNQRVLTNPRPDDRRDRRRREIRGPGRCGLNNSHHVIQAAKAPGPQQTRPARRHRACAAWTAAGQRITFDAVSREAWRVPIPGSTPREGTCAPRSNGFRPNDIPPPSSAQGFLLNCSAHRIPRCCAGWRRPPPASRPAGGRQPSKLPRERNSARTTRRTQGRPTSSGRPADATRRTATRRNSSDPAEQTSAQARPTTPSASQSQAGHKAHESKPELKGIKYR